MQFQSNYPSGINHEFDSIRKLISYENSLGSRIEEIQIECGDYSSELQASLTIDLRFYWGISVEISGLERDENHLKNKIYEVLDGCKAWYWMFYKFDFMLLLVFLLLELLTIILIAIYYFSLKELEALRFLWCIVVLGIRFVINKFHGKLFPKTVFSIGQVIKRQETMEKIQ